LAATLFISDLHLTPQRPGIIRLLRRFLAGTAREAEQLYILGDLFDAWIGDDAIAPPVTDIIADLRDLVETGTWVGLMHGNRDFLIGDRFYRESGCTLLEDPTVVDLYGTPTLLMHGDLLCTDDVGYQEFRKEVRDPGFISAFLKKPIPERLALAAEYRRKSGEATSSKPGAIMDVNEGTVKSHLRTHHVCQLIHGHTHRPDHHHLMLDDANAERWVLPDWNEDRYGFLRADPTGLALQLF